MQGKPAKNVQCITAGLMASVLSISSAHAAVWNLANDWSGHESSTSGPWSFYAAENPVVESLGGWDRNIDTNVSHFQQLQVADWNGGDEGGRLILLLPGEPWYTPDGVQIMGVTDTSQRAIKMLASHRDAMVAWTAPVSATIVISGLITDIDTVTGGGLGSLRISQFTPGGTAADDTELLAIDIPDNGAGDNIAGTYSVETTVNAGDVIFIRKTFFKPDGYGTISSLLTVNIATVDVPEAASLGLLATGALTMLTRRRR